MLSCYLFIIIGNQDDYIFMMMLVLYK